MSKSINRTTFNTFQIPLLKHIIPTRLLAREHRRISGCHLSPPKNTSAFAGYSSSFVSVKSERDCFEVTPYNFDDNFGLYFIRESPPASAPGVCTSKTGQKETLCVKLFIVWCYSRKYVLLCYYKQESYANTLVTLMLAFDDKRLCCKCIVT